MSAALFTIIRCCRLCLVLCSLLLAGLSEAYVGVATAASPHAIGLPLSGLHVRGARLVDAAGHLWLLRGAQIEGLNVAKPNGGERAAIAHLDRTTFDVMHRD